MQTAGAQEITGYNTIDSGNIGLNQLINVASRYSSRTGQNMNGYRIRIASFSGQQARGRSETALSEFHSRYPYINAYRIYSEPDYKIYVGDYRTKTDAYRNLVMLQGDYPTAFIVNSKIQVPDLVSTEIQSTDSNN